MAPGPDRLLLLLPALLACACAPDLCESHEPAFQVDLTLGEEVNATQINRLVAQVSAAGQKKTVTLDIDKIRANRRASFYVAVGPAGASGFNGEVSVEARDALSRILGSGKVTFSGSGDSCNRFGMTLRHTPLPDGGPPPDLKPPPPPDASVDQAPPPPDTLPPDKAPPPPDTTQPKPDKPKPTCGKNGASCNGGKGVCVNGACCTGCWTQVLITFSCKTGNTAKHCGEGGKKCAACLPLHKCYKGICVPGWP